MDEEISPQSAIESLEALCRGEAAQLQLELSVSAPRSLAVCLVAIALGCGSYGFALGLWRAPTQAVFVAMKLPLLVVLTLTVNGILNGMLAQILGSGLSFRQTVHGCLLSFTVFGIIAGALSPILVFLVLNAPNAEAEGASRWHAMFLLCNICVIAIAGVVGNQKLFVVLAAHASSSIVALRVMLTWLAGNLFVGAQLSWILRPLIGNPAIKVQFLRDSPFSGNFYADVFHKLRIASGLPDHLSTPLAVFAVIAIGIAAVSLWQLLEIRLRRQQKATNTNETTKQK